MQLASVSADLKNLYVRANTCVACHQNVPQALLAAGHPELIFELDGQAVSQPKHWSEAADWNGAQAWFVGQAVALREMSWQASKELSPKSQPPNLQKRARRDAVFWLLQKVSLADDAFPSPDFLRTKYTTTTVQNWADKVALVAYENQWSDKKTST